MRIQTHFKNPSAPKAFKPVSPIKVHPAAQTRVRVPQSASTPDAPAPYLPGVGKL
jgi:hypothetical protein